MKLGRPKVDLTGKRFGRLTVVAGMGTPLSGRQPQSAWLCLCDCGEERLVLGTNIEMGHTKSCGCLRRELAIEVGRENRTHGLRGSPAYVSWYNMKQRCTNPHASKYSRYGGAGVKVCDRWLKFEHFVEDMGPRPPGTSLGRFGDVGDYAPGNVAWQTKKQQGAERRKKRAANKERT
jgi:hypothetical protein